ncbi:Thioredoxin reductase 1, cytoplasmic [Schistosoma japonicum]|nr:Thioredoxin reductase 1, cytoplasmic [Schistosoma japonicum]
MFWFRSFCINASRYHKVCLPLLCTWNRKDKSSFNMPPIDGTSQWLQRTIESAAVIVFSKTTCPFCKKLKDVLAEAKIKHATIELDQLSNGSVIQKALSNFSKIETVPQMFVRGKFIGDSKAVLNYHNNNQLQAIVNENKYDYDLIIIGGGSGGLAAGKEAAKYGAKTAVLDYVEPTPMGTTWGLGGTCVNVGCIPKKLMHQAGLLSHSLEDAQHFGWSLDKSKISHDWSTMVEGVQSHIGSLNWGYKVSLRDNAVTYLNARGMLLSPHEVQITEKNKKVSTITGNKIILATGERPKYPEIPGAIEYGITSDDLFSLPYFPGKTLVVGASYVALECAGFLASLGGDVTVMVRSILLRGFDQQMAEKVGDYMENHGVKFAKLCVPDEITQLKPVDTENNKPGLLLVKGHYTDGKKFEEEFETVIFAVGREPQLSKLNCEAVGVKLDKNGRVVCSDDEQTTVSNIYAIGDINAGKPQLTPVAIHAGRYLARRLFAGATELTDYSNVATTVFTPLEYGACGLSEEDAIEKYGDNDIEVYHSHFKPLEWTVAHREDNVCYMKLVCRISDNMRVLGLHVLGPNAGEITQGYAVAIKMGATKEDFDRTIGIHPTCSETFTTLHVTKRSGGSAAVTGC